MRSVLASILALFASIALFASGNTLLGTLSSLRLTMQGLNPAAIGPILACYALGFVFGTLHAGRVIRRVGYIRAAAVFAACAGSAALLHPMTANPWIWALFRAVVGFCISGMLIVTESWISGRATNANRGTLFSVYQVIFYFAAFGGQAMVAAGNPASYEPFSLTAILITLALVPLAMTRRQAPDIGEAERLGMRRLLRISPVALTAAFLSGTVLGAFNMMMPAYGALVGLSVRQVAMLMSLSVLAAMVVAYPAGYFSDRLDRRVMLLLSSSVAAAAALSMLVLPSLGTVGVYLRGGLFMGFAATLYPLSVALMNDRLNTSQLVSASAGLLFSHGTGSVVGPVLASGLMWLLGPRGLFVFLTLAPAALAGVALLRLLWTPRLMPDEQEHYVVAHATTPAIHELDPRNTEFEEK